MDTPGGSGPVRRIVPGQGKLECKLGVGVRKLTQFFMEDEIPERPRGIQESGRDRAASK
jgi:hypothetical protein